jgi:hypothetical protein
MPFANEPGYEAQIGTEEGARNHRTSENGGYERLRVWTVQWAMVDQLRHPTPGFEDAIRTHFRLKRAHILRSVAAWLDEARSSDTEGHFAALREQFEQLKVELARLGPSPCDAAGASDGKEGDGGGSSGGGGGGGDGATEEEMAKVAQLVSLFPDYDPAVCLAALRACDGVLERAVDWVLSTGS